ncbi:uncharacterized protein LOC17897268 [Capsella rubella]|uniref:uncharacterized protein LOC17897268 n=1 Tax=Capsella rubella TaxID=81985 RepID=UPI000CD5959A|nr:uncharacterized protein LOC17897268 [Capsella rubella]
MSLEQTMNDLYEHDQIPHHITKAIWEQLERDIPEFFNRYKKLCELVRQIAMFNELLSQQRDLMQEFTATAPPVTELHKPNDDHQDQIHEEWFDSSDFVFGDDDSFSSFDFMDSFGATDDSIASLIDQSTFPATTHSDPSTSFAATPQSDPPASNGLRYDIDCDGSSFEKTAKDLEEQQQRMQQKVQIQQQHHLMDQKQQVCYPQQQVCYPQQQGPPTTLEKTKHMQDPEAWSNLDFGDGSTNRNSNGSDPTSSLK